MTQGELGGDREVRKREFVGAMDYWGFSYRLFKFPDLGLIFVPLEKMVKKVVEIIRKDKLTVLVSFWPNEVTYGFDHPDHNRAGEVARVASAMVLPKRPRLYLWTSIGKSSKVKERSGYVKKFYGSQFVDEKILKQIGESYLKVR